MLQGFQPFEQPPVVCKEMRSRDIKALMITGVVCARSGRFRFPRILGNLRTFRTRQIQNLPFDLIDTHTAT